MGLAGRRLRKHKGSGIMFRRLFLAGLALFAAGALSAARAQGLVEMASGALELGKADETTFDVSGTPGAFRAVRVKNIGNVLIDLSEVRIVYSDGTVHREERQIDMKPGERSREIATAADDRFIDKVTVVWAKTRSTGKIQILGLQTPGGRKLERSVAGTPPGKPATGNLSEAATSSDPSPAGSGERISENGILFGYQNVGFGLDHDVIKVGGEIGKFDRVRLRVLGNDIHINSLKVAYLDGTSDDVAVDAEIKANTRTGWFAIRGDRFIREIEMSYRSKPNFKGQARIEVTGQYAPGWLGPDGEGVRYNEGWLLLGAQTAGFTGYDKDIIPVGKNEGGFSRLRIMARDRAITLREIRVIFFSGPDEVFQMRERVDPGTPYGPLEFKGGRAAIKEISAKYRSRFDLAKGLKNLFEGTPAVVEIWGQH